MSGPQHLGKFRGTVVASVDPLGLGRLQALVPDVLGDVPTTWALPCLPCAGDGLGVYGPPPAGASVWIEFERGDLDYPIWTGCFWKDSAEVPKPLVPVAPAHSFAVALPGGTGLRVSDLPADAGVRLETGGGARITVTDAEITVETASGAKITVSDRGIQLVDGKGASLTVGDRGCALTNGQANLELSGPSIDLNHGALKID